MPARVFSRLMSGLGTGQVSGAEKLASTLGGFLGILLISVVTVRIAGGEGAVIIVPSMGATAVLLFAVPHGKLSQPWALFGGHLISAVVGVACYRWVGEPFVAAALAVGLAIGAMHVFGCIHPPGGATAIAAVIGGEQVHALGLSYVLSPILINTLIIFVVAVGFNAFFPWRRYPMGMMRFRSGPPVQSTPGEHTLLSDEDLDRAREHMDLLLDVTNGDLQKLFQLAGAYAQDRHLPDQAIKLGHYYTNGRHGGDWSVRQIIDESASKIPEKDMVIYRVVEGRGLHSADSCLRSEFARWAEREVLPNKKKTEPSAPSR